MKKKIVDDCPYFICRSYSPLWGE